MNAKILAKAVAGLVLRQSARAEEIVENARRMVAKKYRGVSWNNVRALARRYVAEAKGIDLVEVTTTNTLSADTQEQFQQLLNDNTIITFKTNKKILGGSILKKNGQILDNSFHTRLNKIKVNTQLTQ